MHTIISLTQKSAHVYSHGVRGSFTRFLRSVLNHDIFPKWFDDDGDGDGDGSGGGVFACLFVFVLSLCLPETEKNT